MINELGGMGLHDSLMIARVIAPVMLTVGLGVLFNPSVFTEMMDEVAKGKHQLLLFITGFFTMILGIFMVMSHNIWLWNWSVLVTLFSWLVLIKGATLIILPKSTMAIAQAFKGAAWMTTLAALGAFVMALVFGYFGYFWTM